LTTATTFLKTLPSLSFWSASEEKESCWAFIVELI
jgi:hypothetical protein